MDPRRWWSSSPRRTTAHSSDLGDQGNLEAHRAHRGAEEALGGVRADAAGRWWAAGHGWAAGHAASPPTSTASLAVLSSTAGASGSASARRPAAANRMAATRSRRAPASPAGAMVTVTLRGFREPRRKRELVDDLDMPGLLRGRPPDGQVRQGAIGRSKVPRGARSERLSDLIS